MGDNSFSLLKFSSSREKRSEWGWFSKPGASASSGHLISSQSLQNVETWCPFSKPYTFVVNSWREKQNPLCTSLFPEHYFLKLRITQERFRKQQLPGAIRRNFLGGKNSLKLNFKDETELEFLGK